jgi:hypothetical protein
VLHLTPPSGVNPIWLERFSPYFTGEFPIGDVRPIGAYRHVYPADDIDLSRIAYFFDYRAENVASEAVREKLAAAVAGWRGRWSGGRLPVLAYHRGPGWMSIQDTRGERPRRIRFDGWRVEAYEYCGDKAHAVDRIADHLRAQDPGWATPNNRLTTFLDSCVAERLMVCEDGKYFSLALPQNENW